jgi:hypothetical protein
MGEHGAEGDALTVSFEVGNNWPTPNNCLRIADALDALTPAKFGDILRAYAHAEDARFHQHGPVEAVRKSLTPPGSGDTDAGRAGE